MTAEIAEDIWSQLDHSLAELKIEAEYQELANSIGYYLGFIGEVDEAELGNEISCWIDDMDEWAKIVCQVYDEVWKIQGHQKTPDFIRAIAHKAVPHWIDKYLERLHGLIDAKSMQHTLPYADSQADRSKRQWLSKCEIEALELEHRGAKPESVGLTDASKSADSTNQKSSIAGSELPETQESHKFDPNQFGGKEICITVSYGKDGKRDMARLSRILADKAHICYSRGEYRDPKSWCQNDIKGFRNHVYKLRKKATDKGWTTAIPGNYWRSYSS